MTQAAAAFLAGLVSFATPCVLPLVPAYLSAIGVQSGDPRSALRAGLPFVAGFSAVFVLLGAGAAVVGGSLADHRLDLVHLAGIVIVAMGFVMMGLLRVPLFERSLVPAVGPARRTGSPLLLGGAFGLCWTPCVGPVLASLLALASSSRTVASGAGLLAVYSDRAGAAVPGRGRRDGPRDGGRPGRARALRRRPGGVRGAAGGGRAGGLLRPYVHGQRLGGTGQPGLLRPVSVGACPRGLRYNRSPSNRAQEGRLTYIIAEPCIDLKDKSCIDVCPVDCIHEFDRMLVIDPEECIDCGACEPECPVEAIYPEDALPDKWEAYVKINYAFPDADVINRLVNEVKAVQ